MRLSNLDKIYWPKEKITKGDMLKYYAAIAPFILPYLKNRPLALKRFPDGIKGEAFFQKDAPNAPSFVKTFPIEHKEKTVNYIVVQNAKSLLYVANLGAIELHPFSSTIKNLDKPSYLAIDLDPEAISFDAVIETAQVVHETLEELDIPSFCKTSGATGLHVYIPLGGKYTYEQIRPLALALARLVQAKLPKITSLERSPSKRQRKIYLDTLQNIRGQLMVCPYSLRARPHAPVSTPLSWSEVKPGLKPENFTIGNILERLKKKGDLFAGVLGRGINLSQVLRKIQDRG